MSNSIAFPFLTLRDSTLESTPWLIGINGEEPSPIGSYIPDWDYACQLEIYRTVNIDIQAAIEDLGIPETDLKLGVLVEVGTGNGRIPRRIVLTKIYSLNSQVEVQISVDSQQLSSLLFINTSVILLASPSKHGALSPKLTNSKLWFDKVLTCLDGDEPRFPIETTSLNEMLGDIPEACALWYVDWNTGDWHRDFLGSVRLFLNNHHPDFIKNIQAGDSFLLQSVSADIMSQILERLISEPTAEEIIADAPPGSLASQALSWIRLAWPNSSLSSIRQKLKSHPGRFRASIWAVADQDGSDL